MWLNQHKLVSVTVSYQCVSQPFVLHCRSSGQLSASIPHSSPWHPGSLSSCFCPDLQKCKSKESLFRTKTSSYIFDPPTESYHTATGLDEPKKQVEIPIRVHNFIRPHSVDPLASSRLKVKEVTVNSVNIARHHRKRFQSESAVKRSGQNFLLKPSLSESVLNGIAATRNHLSNNEQLNSDIFNAPKQLGFSAATCASSMTEYFDVHPSMEEVVNNNCAQSATPLVCSGVTLRQQVRERKIKVNKRSRGCKRSKFPTTLWQPPPRDLYKLVVRVSFSQRF